MSEAAALAAIERHLVAHREVVDKPDVKLLCAVRTVQIERIENRAGASRLHFRARAQRPAPSEVGAGGDPVPVAEVHCAVQRVVVAPAIAWVKLRSCEVLANRRGRDGPGTAAVGVSGGM